MRLLKRILRAVVVRAVRRLHGSAFLRRVVTASLRRMPGGDRFLHRLAAGSGLVAAAPPANDPNAAILFRPGPVKPRRKGPLTLEQLIALSREI